MPTPNQDPSNKPDQPRPLEEEIAMQGARDAIEGRSMDNLMRGQAHVGESEADQIRRVAMRNSGPATDEEAAEARRHAAKLAPLSVDERIKQARKDLLGD